MSQSIKLASLAFQVEYHLIGSLLRGGLTATARDVLSWLQPEMFETANFGAMYRAIQQQALQMNLIDFVLLESDYEQDLAMLAEIMKKTPSFANLQGYAEKVRVFYQRRQARKVFLTVAEQLNQARDEQLDQITAQGLTDLHNLLQRSHKVAPVEMANLLDGYVDLLERRTQPEFKNQMLWTGVQALDDKLGGIGETDICIVAGRAGNGKTETAITFTKNLIEKGKSVLFFSLEMSKEQILERLIASRSGVNSTKLRQPSEMTDLDYSRLGIAISALKEQPLFVVDKSGLTMDELLAIAERHIQQKGKPAAIIIDYIGLVRHGELSGKINRTYQIGESMEKLKTFAKDHHCPVILLAQLNRNADGSRPSNADLRDSGSLEQDASQIIMVHNQRDKKTNEPSPYTEWIVTKNRFGNVGTVYVSFNQGRFADCDQAMAYEALNSPEKSHRSYSKGYGNPSHKGYGQGAN